MLRQPLIWFIKAWRAVISPVYGDVCKFHPTCSAYGLRAVETHGALRGIGLIVRRIARCHPWSAGGVDYVPGTPEAEAWAQENSNESRDESSRSSSEVTV